MKTLLAMPLALISTALFAAEQNSSEQLKDMSDPMAIYTQAGMGITDKGLNFKFGKTYETGRKNQGGMNLIEVKGLAGKSLGFRNRDDLVDGKPIYGSVDDSLDSIRFRNFKVDLENGRGSQLDVNFSFDRVSYAQSIDAYKATGKPSIKSGQAADISYSFMQALPKWGKVQLFPLAGVGVNIENSKENGFEVPGVFALVGMYSKLAITDNFWLMYNPMWATTLAGSDSYTKHQFAGDSSIFANEVSLSYKINPRTSVRYYGNWNDKLDYADGDHRVEFNYQF